MWTKNVSANKFAWFSKFDFFLNNMVVLNEFLVDDVIGRGEHVDNIALFLLYIGLLVIS